MLSLSVGTIILGEPVDETVNQTVATDDAKQLQQSCYSSGFTVDK